MGFQRLLLTNLLGLSAYKYIAEAVTFVAMLIVSRQLGPEEFGLVAMAVLFYAFLSRFADLGLTDAISREHNPELLRLAPRLYIIIGLVLGLLMWLLAYPMAWFFEREEVAPLALCYGVILILYSFSKFRFAILRKQKRFKLIARGELGAVVIQMVLTIILAAVGFSYWSLVLPHFLIPFFYLLYLRHHHREDAHPGGGDHFTLSRPMLRRLMASITVVNFLNYWEGRVDNLWVGKLYGSGPLSLFNRAYMLVNLPVTLLVPHLNTVLLPLLGNNETSDSLRREIEKLFNFLIAVYYVPFLTLFLFPKQIPVLLWGDAWVGVGPYVELLSLAIFWQFMVQGTYSLYLLYRQETRLLHQTLISGLALILLITVGAQYSIHTMIYCYLMGLMGIAVPVTCYLGFIRTFGFKWRQLVTLFGTMYILTISLLAGKYFETDKYEIWILAAMGIISLWKFADYIVETFKSSGKSRM